MLKPSVYSIVAGYPFGLFCCRLENLGCKTRGRPSDGFFKHDTGTGYVTGRQGAYHDALFKKNNTVEILLHENLGGAFSPQAAHRSDATVARPGTMASTARPT